MVCIGGEADIQHAPAHVTGLHRSPQVKTPPTGVVQADVLVCSKKKTKLNKIQRLAFVFVWGFFTGRSEVVCFLIYSLGTNRVIYFTFSILSVRLISLN